MKLFQRIIPGYVDVGSSQLQNSNVGNVYLPPKKIIPWKLFQTKLFRNLVHTLEYFFKGWVIVSSNFAKHGGNQFRPFITGAEFCSDFPCPVQAESNTCKTKSTMHSCHAPFDKQILESTGGGSLQSNHDSPSCNDLVKMILSNSAVDVSKRKHDWTQRCGGQISLRNWRTVSMDRNETHNHRTTRHCQYSFLTDFDGLQGYDFINFPRLTLGALEVLFRSPSPLA